MVELLERLTHSVGDPVSTQFATPTYTFATSTALALETTFATQTQRLIFRRGTLAARRD